MNVISHAIDDDYRVLVQDVLNGTSTSSYSRSLKSEMASLSVSDGLILLDSRRIVLRIPVVKSVLHLLHASHSGINKTILLARGLYYWPGMINDVKQLVLSCRECSWLLQSQPGNPMTTAPPSSHFGYHMQHVGLDLFSFGGKSFLICIDHWSFLPELSPGQAVLLQDPKTSAWTRKGMISNIRPDHLSYTVEVDGCSFIRPCHMLRAIPLENSSPPTQAPAQVSPSLPWRSVRLQLRAAPRTVNTVVPSNPSTPSFASTSQVWVVPTQCTKKSGYRTNKSLSGMGEDIHIHYTGPSPRIPQRSRSLSLQQDQP